MDDEIQLIGNTPTPGQKITELHCWVATYRDGSEGIIAANLDSLGMAPLISPRLKAVQSLEQMARAVQRRSLDTKIPVVNVRIVSFAMVKP